MKRSRKFTARWSELGVPAVEQLHDAASAAKSAEPRMTHAQRVEDPPFSEVVSLWQRYALISGYKPGRQHHQWDNMSSIYANWRSMEDADLPRVDEIADSIHSLFERAEVFAEKFRLYRPGCLVLEVNGTVSGYGISHPWMLGSIPPLDTFLEGIPAKPECLYIHDVAILPSARGHGSSQTLCQVYADLAKSSGMTRMALVSVYGTAPLWTKSGFAIADDPLLDVKLASYGTTARYMIKTVA